MNGRGRDQACAVGRTLTRLLARAGLRGDDCEHVASPLGRAVETMRLLRAAAGLAPDAFRTDPRLKELSFGSWEGLTWGELEATDPAGYAARRRDKWGFAPPGGESYAALRDRVEPWLASVPDNTVVVAHGGVARVLLHVLAGLETKRAPGAEIWQGRVLRFQGDRATWV